VAMKWGPVPSQGFDMMKAAAGVQPYPRLNVGEAIGAQGYTLRAKRPAREELISESERACLVDAINKIAPLDFKQRSIETHDAVWKAASANGVITAADIAKDLQDSAALVDYLES